MIHFFIGTKAQLIKMAPVMAELKKRNVAYRYIDSGQHYDTTKRLRASFDIQSPDICLNTRGDIASIWQATIWAIRVLFYCLMPRYWVRKRIFDGQNGICLIHGDTLSTLFGLWLAKGGGLLVGHVEAGLRSFNKFDPFPEELIRIHCMRKCDILFAPSDVAKSNLEAMQLKGLIIGIEGNTVVDALRLAEQHPISDNVPSGPYILATCHRYETISNKSKLTQVVQLLNSYSEQLPVFFVVHKPTHVYLKRFKLLDELSPRVQLLGMQDYLHFISLMRSARIVVSDGGSIQEECGYLDKPCLLIRNETERMDGLGISATLWKFDADIAKQFIVNALAYESKPRTNWTQPSIEIVDYLQHAKFI